MTRVIQKAGALVPNPLDTTAERAISLAFPSGAHVVEVEIDSDTGAVEVVNYTAVDDIGTVINSVLADGQVVGGIMQGAGQVFGENCQYDETNGQLPTGSFMDYALPRASYVHVFNVVSHPVPTKNNPVGVKGAGEAGTVGVMPVVVSAVADAFEVRDVVEVHVAEDRETALCMLFDAGRSFEERVLTEQFSS